MSKIWGYLTILIVAAALSGCATSGGNWDLGIGGGVGGGTHVGGGTTVGGGVHRAPGGPPNYAPAHGHRKRHSLDNVELVYDAALGVYVAEGYQGTYFRDEYYYRDLDDHWEYSSRIRGPWNSVGVRKLPHGLKKIYRERDREDKEHRREKYRKGKKHGRESDDDH